MIAVKPIWGSFLVSDYYVLEGQISWFSIDMMSLSHLLTVSCYKLIILVAFETVALSRNVLHVDTTPEIRDEINLIHVL